MMRSITGDNVKFREARQEDGSYLVRLATPDSSREEAVEHRIFLQDEMFLFPLKHFVSAWGRRDIGNELVEMAEILYEISVVSVRGTAPSLLVRLYVLDHSVLTTQLGHRAIQKVNTYQRILQASPVEVMRSGLASERLLKHLAKSQDSSMR